MKDICIAFWAEYMKTRKSKIFFATLIVFTFIPLMIGLMLFVSRNPEIAGKLGMVGTKAKMFGENDWLGYFSLLNQSIASVGFIGFGFVTSWVFGREHIDRTLKDILALPIGRSFIVLAKLISVVFWCITLSIVLYLNGILLGLAMNIPGWSVTLLSNFSYSFFSTVLLTLLLCTPISWLTGYSRGIIAPLGFVIFTMIVAQFIGLIGLGPYFPWSIPGLHSITKDTQGLHLNLSSYFIYRIVSA